MVEWATLEQVQRTLVTLSDNVHTLAPGESFIIKREGGS